MWRRPRNDLVLLDVRANGDCPVSVAMTQRDVRRKERDMCEERDMRREKERVSTVMKSKRDQKRISVSTVFFYRTYCLFELISFHYVLNLFLN